MKKEALKEAKKYKEGSAIDVVEKGSELAQKYLSKKEMTVRETDDVYFNPIIIETNLNLDFKHEFKKEGISKELIGLKIQAINEVGFSLPFLKRLTSKLRLDTAVQLQTYILEYKKFLLMIALGN
jgi:hypothetical protein